MYTLKFLNSHHLTTLCILATDFVRRLAQACGWLTPLLPMIRAMVAVWFIDLSTLKFFIVGCFHIIEFIVSKAPPEDRSGLPLPKQTLEILKAGQCFAEILERYLLWPIFYDNSIARYDISPVELPLHRCLRLSHDFPWKQMSEHSIIPYQKVQT